MTRHPRWLIGTTLLGFVEAPGLNLLPRHGITPPRIGMGPECEGAKTWWPGESWGA
jgi:hypothetical protein